MPPTPPQALLELKKVTYVYPSMPSGVPVIDCFDLNICTGDIIRVSGRNGSGKTTLLKLITGEFAPVHGDRIEKKPGLRTVYLNQYTGDFLGESLTVREQLAMGFGAGVSALYDVRATTIEKRILGVLCGYGVGLEGKLDCFTCDLSGGQRQIVALLAVLQKPVDILALDEFTAHMDAESAAVSVGLLQQLVNDQEHALLFTGHDSEKLMATREVRL